MPIEIVREKGNKGSQIIDKRYDNIIKPILNIATYIITSHDCIFLKEWARTVKDLL